ncbi:MAG: hypothetical protein P4L43_02170 [Syntrophobacteraceae bacterium]|nr:hypothetical protein [Syntrophobacteraceae bacterium]
MISTILALLGITLIYTGFLASSAHITTGIVATCAGVVFLAKPALEALKLYRKHFGGAPQSGPRGGGSRKRGAQKVYLKIVKSEDEKPTIH